MLYTECYVAFIDILGFKEFVRKNNCQTIQAVLLNLKTEESAGPSALQQKYGISLQDMKIRCVSDSVIISIKKDITNSLEAIIWMCAAFQTTLFLNSHLLMRGYICCGDFYIDDEMLFGPAYQCAVILESKHNMPRILLDDAIDTTNMIDTEFLNKGIYDGKYFVDYMSLVVKTAYVGSKLESVEGWIRESIEKFKDDEKNLTKYIWLVKYYNAMLSNSRGLSRFLINLEDKNNGQP